MARAAAGAAAPIRQTETLRGKKADTYTANQQPVYQPKLPVVLLLRFANEHCSVVFLTLLMEHRLIVCAASYV